MNTGVMSMFFFKGTHNTINISILARDVMPIDGTLVRALALQN